MRCMPANRRRMWLSKPTGLTELVDEEGYGTGEYVNGWTDPVSLLINASTPSGACSAKPYGIFASYDLSLVADENKWGIEEGDRMWRRDDKPDLSDPEDAAKGSYKVDRVSPSLNFVSIGLQKSEGE